jgi:hypothetical protein
MLRQSCPGPIRRREFLQLGSLSLGGLSLKDVLAQRDAAGSTAPVASRIRGMNAHAIPPYVAIPGKMYMTLV